MPKVHSTNAGNGGRRRGRGSYVGTSLSEINVVPLVDVMLVLLIIFMVTAPMMQQGLSVNLPQVRRADPVTSQPIYVTIPANFGETRVVQIGDDDVRVDILHERVRQAILPREDKSLFLRMDATVTAQNIMDVMDQLKQAGVEKIGITTQPRVRR
ncbi:MAG: biopolymer transporter ExbD [Vicinamibacterales bacterium]